MSRSPQEGTVTYLIYSPSAYHLSLFGTSVSLLTGVSSLPHVSFAHMLMVMVTPFRDFGGPGEGVTITLNLRLGGSGGGRQEGGWQGLG